MHRAVIDEFRIEGDHRSHIANPNMSVIRADSASVAWVTVPKVRRRNGSHIYTFRRTPHLPRIL
jgi:hypothetical protein